MLNRSNFIFILLIILSVLSIIFVGIILFRIFQNETEPPKPIDNKCPNNNECQCPDSVIPNCSDEATSDYFNDTVLIVTNTEPRKALIATISWTEGDNKYKQTSRASFYDGSWDRKTKDQSITDANFKTNSLISNWDVGKDPNGLTEKDFSATLNFNNSEIIVDIPYLNSEIVMRDRPGYTKFLSESEGKLIIDGVSHDAKAVYINIYSNDSSQVLVYDNNVKFQTYWLIFWDGNQNFYHIDTTNVFNEVENYKSHSVGYEKNSKNQVQSTFTINASSQTNKPSTLNLSMGENINKPIIFNFDDKFQKYPGIGYEWVMGLGEGTVNIDGQSIYGYGIGEYIYKN